MSLRDDFLEALRSVKRDFIRDYDSEPEADQGTPRIIPSEGQFFDEDAGDAPSEPVHASEPEPPADTPPVTPPSDDYFRRPVPDPIPEANAFYEPERHREPMGAMGAGWGEESRYEPEDDDSSRIFDGDVPPGNGGRYIFDEPDSYSDAGRTVISKNTVIRGALQTEDSLQMFGQIMGDIDCKSNILMAGKVRGNTTAANAYVIDAQVDGNVLCDDVVSVKNDAWILGNIRAQQADIDGKIKGNIEIRHSISIGSNSSVIGNISTDELEIKRGAFINGQIMMYSPSRDVIDKFDRFE